MLKKILFKIVNYSTNLHNNHQEQIALLKAIHGGVKFQQAIQDCPWLKIKGFSLGDFHYAMDALALHNLFRILEDVKPKNILEFGLGQSSKLVHQYAEYFQTNALTIEHDGDWIIYMKTHAPDVKFNIRQADLEKIKINNVETVSYKNVEKLFSFLPDGGTLIIVDGPPYQPHYSRPQILSFVSQLEKDFCIFIHDSQRIGEKETIAQLHNELSNKKIEFLQRDYHWSSVQQHTVLCSKSWKFLTSI